MKDREFLMWIHERLEHVHGERPIVDYMHKLRAVISTIPEDRETMQCDVLSCNSLPQNNPTAMDGANQRETKNDHQRKH